MFYKIIGNRETVDRFLLSITHNQHQQYYYLMLASRKKYGATFDTELAHAFVKKENIVNQLEKFEVKLGLYRDKHGNPVPENSIVCYISLTQKNERTALSKFITELGKILEKQNETDTYFRLQDVVHRVLIKSNVKSNVKTFDIDLDYLPDLTGILNPDAYRVLKTANGFHLIVETSNIAYPFKTTWYNKIKEFTDPQHSATPPVYNENGEAEEEKPDEEGNKNLIPFPGTYQGGFVTYFL